MPDKRIADGPTDDQIDAAVLHCLLWNGWLWSLPELAREMGDEPNTIDAIGRLTRSGLVHRLGEFVFPTRSARRANDLQIGTV